MTQAFLFDTLKFQNKVQAAGGGIHFTTEKTKEASEEELLSNFLEVIFKF